MAKNEIRFVIEDPGVGRVRDELGRFITRDVQANRAHFARLAEKGQAEVVAYMAGNFLRPTVSTGRLLRVTASVRNRDSNEYGFGVGVIKYLDKSEAKYWRTIEEGSKIAWADTPGNASQMAGLVMRGKFGASITGWRESSWGPRPVAGPAWGAKPGYFAAIRKLPEITIKQEIRPQHAYEQVYHGAIFHGAAQEVITSMLRKAARTAVKGR